MTGRGRPEKKKSAARAITAKPAATGAQRFIAAQNGIGEEANQTMEQLRQAAAAVQRLADFLERHPNSIITGRKPE